MGRNSGSGGCLLGLVVWPCFGGFVLGFPAMVLAAPAVVPYYWWADRAQLEENGSTWIAMAAASPLLAAALVWWAGRLPFVPTVTRAVVLLAATSGAALAVLILGADPQQPAATRELFTTFGAAALAAAVVLGFVRFRARAAARNASRAGTRTHAGPRDRDRNRNRNHVRDRRPVTVETVRQASADGDRTLHRVRAENRRLERLVRDVEQKLAAPTADFSVLCQLHHESRGCADAAHGSYRSARTSCDTMASLVRRVGYASRVRLGHGRAAELASAGAALATTRDRLGTEVARGLGLVRTLNANTAQLKHRIRDDCGTRGADWFAALEERIAARG